LADGTKEVSNREGEIAGQEDRTEKEPCEKSDGEKEPCEKGNSSQEDC
jgi:hypothetical protein